jgi:hypothetical protein
VGSVPKMAPDPQATVLEALRDHEYLPVELMDFLEKHQHLSDASLKSAILELLQQMKIEFGPNLKLRLRPEKKASSSSKTT